MIRSRPPSVRNLISNGAGRHQGLIDGHFRWPTKRKQELHDTLEQTDGTTLGRQFKHLSSQVLCQQRSRCTRTAGSLCQFHRSRLITFRRCPKLRLPRSSFVGHLRRNTFSESIDPTSSTRKEAHAGNTRSGAQGKKMGPACLVAGVSHSPSRSLAAIGRPQEVQESVTNGKREGRSDF